jgi:uncharacterized protein YjiS (DUF1127 family)
MSIVNLVISAGRAFSQWRRREQTYAELMALDDHSLADIGIHRSQIGALVQGVRVPDPSLPPVFSTTRQEKFARRKAA